LRKGRAAATLFLALAAHSTLGAQIYEPTKIQNVLIGNVAIGGVTAALHAAIKGDNIGKAFVVGALGGGVHAAGKMFEKDIGLASMGLGAIGTSIVANAGRGVGALDQIVLPIGPARLRFDPRNPRGVRASLNVYETAYAARQFFKPGMRVDWTESGRSGTLVFRQSDRVFLGSLSAAGLTAGSAIILSDKALDPARTATHERVHVQQGWFLQEVWGRPIEQLARDRTPFLRWIPGWLDLGVVTPGLISMELRTIGLHGPMRTMRETEAETLELPDPR
jgi:hypothetical protein